MIASDAQRALLTTERWSWLGDVVDRWYAEPLTAADGSTPDEVAAAADRAGGGLPVGVAEWFTLVGRRLRAVQDAASTPGTVRRAGGGVVVWEENQGVWALIARADGVCVLDEEDFPFPPTPLPEALHGMVLSDTLVGVWAGTRVGPLGRLAPGVRGGTAHVGAGESAAYPELAVPGNPFWGTPPRGDADTVLRGDADLEWMTATRAAFDRLARVVALDPPGGPQEVVVAFEGLTGAEQAVLTDRGVPDIDRFAAAVEDLGHISMGAASADGVRFHVTTDRPEEAIAALRGAVPEGLADKVVVAVRPERVSSFRVVHPAGRDEYVLPD
ncbi:hypothetical protein [Saccharothrix obliqua]|uniref:hypothetical protein n=1 Tax=Saccharothrix obliqua TaxID=2861747 RepID=UPI001C5D1627|nr:hypothetical protein [Saccharothrix obliqua]MBW4718756.1 hypothetical protein [Saccharothrix obliqua]